MTSTTGDGDVRPGRAGAAVLEGARVGVVGVGALGHLVALDLARVGIGHLHLIDGDHVTADTASRQYPVIFAGRSKAVALRELIRWFNPWQGISIVDHQLGRHGRDPFTDLDARLDLVVDATAEPAVTRFLGHWADSADARFVSVSATAGGRGGTLLRLPSCGGGCYRCLEHHRADRALPVPPELDGSWVRPPRCSEATFTGYGHDLALVAHQASRLVLATLLGPVDPVTRDAPAGDDPVDYWVADLPRDGGPARWTAVPLPVHADCPHPHRLLADRQLPLWTHADLAVR
jgi:hypothetical protein